MSFASGSRLGHYEILTPLGAGGMGEVYRARDFKLGRDVALKVLPDAFARDPDRMARFQREAKILASLSHPNIAAIYGLEDSDHSNALVMELVEGPTLADRIKQGPVPGDEALRIAKQICEGLEYAHERGIVHRDLKPANIKVRNDDTVKVLDFGLAKALDGDEHSQDISTSPTISHMATQAGILLGTAAYMSPEQARGKSVDRRADIWAFGCVILYRPLPRSATWPRRRASFWAPRRTCPPSRRVANPLIVEPTSGLSGACSLKCWPANARLRARRSATRWRSEERKNRIGLNSRRRRRCGFACSCNAACTKTRSNACATLARRAFPSKKCWPAHQSHRRVLSPLHRSHAPRCRGRCLRPR